MTDDFAAPVSVVVPCFRCASTIERALASIMRQTMKPAEVILVDDASGDGTFAVLHGLAQQHPGWIKVIALDKNLGAASARNAGWEAASQPYLAFLDADDAWHPEKIRIQYLWMMAHPEYGLTGHAHSVERSRGEQCAKLYEMVDALPVSPFQALLSCPFSTSTVMLKRDLPFRFKEHKRYIEDYLLWLQMILSGVPSVFIDAPLAMTFKPDFGAAGLSAQLWEMEKGELDTYREVHKAGLLGFLPMLCLLAYSLVKYVRRLVIVKINRLTKREQGC